jgi:hypothetical protein
MVEIAFIDIERAIRDRDPQLGDMLCRYLEQSDPEPGKAELPTAADLDNPSWEWDDPDVPDGAMTLSKLRQQVGAAALRGKTATEAKLARREAWGAALASPYTPPRLRLGALLIEMYDAGDAAGRAALAHVFANGRLGWGVWRAIKAIYKRAEAAHDLRMLGVIGCRFDRSGNITSSEVGAGTITYIRSRVWRYLRTIGRHVPDAYPAFAVEVLRHYPAGHGPHTSSWVAANIWGWKNLRGGRIGAFTPPRNMLDARAYPETWKVSPAPLLRLLDQAENDTVIGFAIASLRADHPLSLRAVEPAWLARLGRRPSPALHSFVLALIKDSAELHQSRLRAVGLHEVVLGWLRSSAADARAYALEYATAHAPDLSVLELVALLALRSNDVVEFASRRLADMAAADIGAPVLIRLLRHFATRDWAATKFSQGFAPGDIDVAAFIDVAVSDDQARAALVKVYGGNAKAIPAAYLTALLADARVDHRARNWALNELGKRSAADIGIAWIQRAIEDRELGDAVQRWLSASMLNNDKLDVDWLKGLIAKPRLRALALATLGDRRLITPARIGLDWLLEMARSADNELHTFAHRLLLEHFAPEDFAEAGGDRAAGIERLWQLAAGKGRPEQVRAFGQIYLRAHHPVVGLTLAEAKQLGIKPKLAHDDYPLARVRPLLVDDRADVRRFAAGIAQQEIVRWGEAELLYALAGSGFPEPRRVGIELLLSLAAAGDGAKVPASWLDGRALFTLAESPYKATREAALTLIRRAYDRVGGAERLVWLMESPERDVRLFAVRLFWDRHRPRPVPEDYKPPRDVGAPLGGERFADTAALRQFLRTILFGLPPGRLEQRDALPDGAMPERPLPASIAKRRLIEAVRDLGEADAEFARVLSPVLIEMSASVAKGEWQACVAALAAMRLAHPDLGSFGLPAPRAIGGRPRS